MTGVNYRNRLRERTA